MKVKIEVTDTYGHEANYSWVRRYEMTLPMRALVSDYSIVRMAKARIGWRGKRCVTVRQSDCIEIRPMGECVVCFITFESEEVAA